MANESQERLAAIDNTMWMGNERMTGLPRNCGISGQNGTKRKLRLLGKRNRFLPFDIVSFFGLFVFFHFSGGPGSRDKLD